ncbi:hypothetical protein FQA39_LY08806 [Lamprigera yunnana]|nr:hypothetical protein FQA39_LY08806 [Lamprigera yunnana]
MILFLFFFILSKSFALELPSYFPKCCVDDSDISNCVLKAALKLKPYIINGVKEIEIPRLYPLVLPNFYINYNTEDIHFESDLRNFTLYGMNKYDIENLEFDPKELQLKGKLLFKELFFHSFCDIKKGEMVNVPIIADGIFGGLMGPLNLTFNISGSFVTRNGKQFAELKDAEFDVDIAEYVIQYEGLKYENGPWGNTNKIIRNNSERLSKAIAGAYKKMFKGYATNYLKWFLGEIAYFDLFPC